MGEFHLLTSGPIDDLFFSIYPSVAGTDLRLGFEANPALYTARDLDLHSRQFERTLDQFVTVPPETTVGQIEVLTTDERWQLVPSAGLPAGEPATLPTILAWGTHVGGSRKVALRANGQELTYGELRSLANVLCTKLVDRGIGPGDVVAILAPRSAQSVIAFHAVVRSGAALLFVDPGYPAERIEFMLTDARVRVALTSRVIPLTACVEQVGIADSDLTEAGERERLAPRAPSLGDVAYVVYTSGSTGQPKGVAVTHRGATSLLNAHVRNLEVDASATDRPYGRDVL